MSSLTSSSLCSPLPFPFKSIAIVQVVTCRLLQTRCFIMILLLATVTSLDTEMISMAEKLMTILDYGSDCELCDMA